MFLVMLYFVVHQTDAASLLRFSLNCSVLFALVMRAVFESMLHIHTWQAVCILSLSHPQPTEYLLLVRFNNKNVE